MSIHTSRDRQIGHAINHTTVCIKKREIKPYIKKKTRSPAGQTEMKKEEKENEKPN